MTMRAQRPGFTLIELLIVLVLVAILSTIGLSRFWVAKDRALISAMKGDLRTLATQQEVYYERHFHYAPTLGDLPDYQLSPSVEIVITHAANAGWGATAASPSVSEQCGYFYGTVPTGAAPPATVSGVVLCN
jgi:prepilin-type N-terminal cleavage/methylation domain-containing protein